MACSAKVWVPASAAGPLLRPHPAATCRQGAPGVWRSDPRTRNYRPSGPERWEPSPSTVDDKLGLSMLRTPLVRGSEGLIHRRQDEPCKPHAE